MKTKSTIGAALAATFTLGLAAAPAHAEVYVETCTVSSKFTFQCLFGAGIPAALTRYSDDSNALCSVDKMANGKSAVAVYWKKGRPRKKQRIWAHGGEGNIVCRDLGAKRENGEWILRACIGEWAPAPANRRVVSCGPSRSFFI